MLRRPCLAPPARPPLPVCPRRLRRPLDLHRLPDRGPSKHGIPGGRSGHRARSSCGRPTGTTRRCSTTPRRGTRGSGLLSATSEQPDQNRAVAQQSRHSRGQGTSLRHGRRDTTRTRSHGSPPSRRRAGHQRRTISPPPRCASIPYATPPRTMPPAPSRARHRRTNTPSPFLPGRHTPTPSPSAAAPSRRDTGRHSGAKPSMPGTTARHPANSPARRDADPSPRNGSATPSMPPRRNAADRRARALRQPADIPPASRHTSPANTDTASPRGASAPCRRCRRAPPSKTHRAESGKTASPAGCPLAESAAPPRRNRGLRRRCRQLRPSAPRPSRRSLRCHSGVPSPRFPAESLPR